MRGLWDRVTGHHSKIKQQNEAEAKSCKSRDDHERQTLINHQLLERRVLQSKIKASRKRQASLLRDLRSDVGRYLTMGQEPDPPLQRQRRRKNRTRNLSL